MTAKKRVTSIICILSLILAITVGLVLSVGAQPNNYYGGESVSLSNTDVTVNAQTSTKSGDKPEGAVEITSADDLQKFIKGETGFAGDYGYITAEEITLDWSGVGAQAYLAAGRTIDGNGNTVKLKDDQANANVSNKTGDNASLSGTNGVVQGITDGSFKDPLDNSDTRQRTYGMFVDYNMGTIQNIKFVYEQTAHSVANANVTDKNYAGIVCGNNSGTITNCDLTVGGNAEFGYFYCQGSNSNNTDKFTLLFGGIAGRNGGKITNITAQYDSFTCILNVRGRAGTLQRANARVAAGGIAGTMYSTKAECSNIIITATANTKYTLTAQRVNAISEGKAYRELAAVVPANSKYSQAEYTPEEQKVDKYGENADTQAKVDNIIVDFAAQVNSHTMGDYYSQNAVVFCGRSTNVTILTTSNKTVNNQHVDYQTDHCDCGVGDNTGQHATGYGNLIHTGDHSNVTVGFDENNNQVITVTPKENSILGELAFNKFEGRGTVTDGSLEPGLSDDATYSDVANNGPIYLYNMKNNEGEYIRDDKYVFTVRPYQAVSNKFWEVYAYSYEIATMGNTVQQDEYVYTYTGKDFLTEQLSFNASKSGIANPEGFNARTTEGVAVNVGRLPGTYTFTLQEKEAGLAYVDTVNKVVAYVEETPTEYSFTVINAKVVDIDAGYLDPNWLSERVDFEFWLVNGIEGAADGYVYVVNGSAPTKVNNLIMRNNNDTASVGRTYEIYLTSGGVQVTDPYTYTVKIDMTAPNAQIINAEHPADRYYTHNTITISATDRASGVASIKMYSDGVEKIDIMNTVEPNEDGTYTLRFSETGKNVIEVIDVAGNKSEVEVDILIDKTKPTIEVEAYYYAEDIIPGETDADGNPVRGMVQKTYTSDKEVTSAVYFKATATFGESGGEIRYTLDGGKTWQVLVTGGEGAVSETLVVKTTGAKVGFNAVANTYDHPDTDVAPYPNTKRINTLWAETVTVNIQLEKVEITFGDIVISNASKVFDGTTNFDLNNISVRDDFESEKDIKGVRITSVKYADVNAGEDIALIIDVTCDDDTKIIVNKIEGAVGSITKKEISVVVDSQNKYYGYALPTLTYTVDMVAGFEEIIPLYVQKGEGNENVPYELLPQSQTDPELEGYVITVVEGTILKNYEIVGITTGLLHINLAPVDRLVYEKGAFTGLDIYNIAGRNLEIGFIRANGNYEKLVVKFYGRDRYYDSNDNLIDNGYSKEIKDITKAPAGFYKVVISLPERDSNGDKLTDKYYISEDLFLEDTVNKDHKKYNFMIKIIDASIFDKQEEEPAKQEPTQSDSNQAKQDTPSVNNSVNGQVGMYEDGSANTDSTDTTIESVQQKKDYIAMVSIFCAVAITIAFALGVGRAIFKRVRK